MWLASTHETRGLACTDCHTVMRDVSRKSSLRTAWEPDTCFQCHKNKRAEIWRTSHMPVREGNMNCGSCHNPHGTPNESMLKRATVNDTCYGCHAEKTRAVPVGTRTRAGELSELPRSPRVGKRLHAQGFAAANVPAVSQRVERSSGQPAQSAVGVCDQSRVPKLSLASARVEQPIRYAVDALRTSGNG
jgi:predicted CXXCH cytochrome family protein